jgi:flagellar protein FliO/FliZ
MEWARAVFALAATLALLGLAALAARRFNLLNGIQSGPGRRLSVVERLMLDPRRALLIVRIDGKDRALLVSPFGDKDLGETTAMPSPAPPEQGQ